MNKYLHTVACVGFLFTLNYDARNNELKKKNISLFPSWSGKGLISTPVQCVLNVPCEGKCKIRAYSSPSFKKSLILKHSGNSIVKKPF